MYKSVVITEPGYYKYVLVNDTNQIVISKYSNPVIDSIRVTEVPTMLIANNINDVSKVTLSNLWVFKCGSTFMLSQDEIDAIQKELEEAINQMNQPKTSNNNPIPISSGTAIIKVNQSGNWVIDESSDGTKWTEYKPTTIVYDGPKPKAVCMQHKWKSYFGLNEQYEFCEICDEKRK